jgi:hypothetical protein
MKTRKQAPAPTPIPDGSDEQTVTTLALPTDVWVEVKMRAAQERRSLRALVQRAIEAYLQTPLQRAEKETA